MHVLVVFGNGRGVFTRLCKVRVCNLHNPHHTGHIENHKQHTADLQLVALFHSHLVLVAHKHRLDGGVYF